MEGPWTRIGWPLPFAPLVRLLDYWTAKRGGRPCPDSDEIDPSEIFDLLPDVMIMDAAEDGLDVVYRYVGRRLAARIGKDLNGRRRRDVVTKPVDFIERKAQQRLDRQFTWVARSLNGAFRVGDLSGRGRPGRRFASLILPLTCIDGRAQHLIEMVVDAAAPYPNSLKGDDGFAICGQTLLPMNLPADHAPRLY